MPGGDTFSSAQQAEIDRSFPINGRDCVLLGCWGATGAWGGGGGNPKTDDEARAGIGGGAVASGRVFFAVGVGGG